MNFETGVISVSSPSIGAWAEAPPAVSVTTSRARASIPSRVIDVLLGVRSGRPAAGPLDGAPPAGVALRARRGVRRGLERPLDRVAGRHRVERAPEAGAEPGQVRGAERRRLDHRRPDDGRVQYVRLELAEE